MYLVLMLGPSSEVLINLVSNVELISIDLTKVL